MRYMLMHGKIHRATVTEADLEYMGSITIDAELMEMAGILPETAPLPGEGWYTGLDRLMGLVSAALEKAEATDPLLAARLLDWLIEWTANERLVIPPPPPADPAYPPA